MKLLKILHAIPGRTRISFPYKEQPNQIEALARSCPGVYSATYSKETRALLLYHYTFITVKDILLYLKKERHNSIQPRNTTQKQLRTLGLATTTLLFDLMFPSSVKGFRAFFSPTALLTLYLSKDVLENGLRGVQKYKANADTLSLTAIFASILQGSVRSALMITILSSFGDYLAYRASDRTQRHLKDLLQSEVKTAWIVGKEGAIIRLPSDKVNIGDTVVVYDGERIPVDGIVVKGTGIIDESAITGEFIPKETQENSFTFAGTILKQGNIYIKAQKVGKETQIKQIVRLIEEAHSQKAGIQLSVDRLANRLVFVSFLMATLVYGFTRDWNRALNMLVIDFCCGLKLASTTAFAACIGKAAHNGILIRGGQTVEELSRVDTIVLDKTGTVTMGQPYVEEMITLRDHTEKDLLKIAASIEQYSSHPLGSAIVKKAEEQSVELVNTANIRNVPGQGISAEIDGTTYYVGNVTFIKNFGSSVKELDTITTHKAMSAVYVGNKNHVIGVLYISDQIRDHMHQAVASLKEIGMNQVSMLTGDRFGPAQEVAQKLGIDSFVSEMLPEDKVTKIKELKENGHRVLMVGDGINDAPALAHADVGISFGGKKTDIAVEASDITISSNDPMTLPTVYDLSKRTIRTVHQGITMILTTNGIAMVCGAIGLLSPLASAVIHNSATVFVALNSARLYRAPLLIDKKGGRKKIDAESTHRS